MVLLMKVANLKILTILFLGLNIPHTSNAKEVATQKVVKTVVPDIKSMSDEDLLVAYERVASDPLRNFCENISVYTNEMVSRAKFRKKFQLKNEFVNFECALNERRWPAAYHKMLMIEKLIDNSLGSLGFVVAHLSDHHVEAVDRLVAITRSPVADELLALDMDIVYSLSRYFFTKNEPLNSEKVLSSMFNSVHFGKLNPSHRSRIAENLLDLEAGRGALANAPKYLSNMVEMQNLSYMLSSRTFEKAWPLIEKTVGKNMTTISEKSVAQASSTYSADTANRKAFQEFAHALHYAGKFEDVVALVQTFDHNSSNISNMTEDDAWALNVEAYSLDALGRPAEAEKVFDLITSVPYDSMNTAWLVSFAINQALRFVETGQWQKGFEAASLAEKIADKSGNAYAKILINQAKVCSLSALGRTAEALLIADEVFKSRKASYSIAAVSMLCLGENDKAAKIAIEGLSDAEGKGGVVADLQKREFQLFYTRSKLPTLRELLRSRPDVSAAFDKVARDIPDEFMPLAGIQREKMFSKSHE
jgi:tetratricopeptide (TPR) repeat protein